MKCKILPDKLFLFLRLSLLLLLPLLKTMVVCAQQDAMFSQYMFNTLAVNPAYAGSRNVLSLTAMHRNQWVGMKGAPKTTTFSADMPTWNNKLGLGFIAFNDEIGVTKSTGFYGVYNYRIRFTGGGTLAIGLQGGVTNYKANLAGVSLKDQNDPAFANNINSFLPTFGAGVFYSTDKFYAGFSAPNIIKSYLRKDVYLYSSELIAQKFEHMFLMAGYVFDMGNDIKLKPSFLVKYVKGAPIQADINTQVWLKDVISVGGSFRTDKSGAILTEIQCTPQFRLGYSYDISNKSLAAYNRGSHEVMIRYEFGFEKGKVLSPRYF
ncbi:type IX secretion system membrane protein PorP/SprF [Chitinophaga solisilvae]|uniref:Type IX secretion system membrane protein PorP/SprF n=1 Tax=Chitinophaga solisilvae TaxID=1233460 RepID=A0A433WBQ3_9BACT|nr:type IX secretion system membrane protein PorP/SprF [Chitinophaga solisilvae]NSL87633.1 type IX secretion system membrane protein PorP/SprF [Chitinophaga solisilvae]